MADRLTAAGLLLLAALAFAALAAGAPAAALAVTSSLVLRLPL